MSIWIFSFVMILISIGIFNISKNLRMASELAATQSTQSNKVFKLRKRLKEIL